MSKWSLLRSAAIVGKRDSSSQSSIHHFNGFNLVEKKKCFWLGFESILSTKEVTKSVKSLCDKIYDIMVSLDTCGCEITICIDTSDDFMNFLLLVNEGVTNSLWTLNSSDGISKIKLGVVHPTFQPTMRLCDFNSHVLIIASEHHSESSKTVTIYTREKRKESGLTARALLSNKLHNVDNTGNVCVWPSESILLHTLLNNTTYLSLVQKSARTIELGGGLTALAGLGLAASGMSTGEVVITDGHPDCVANQNICIHMNKQKGSISANYPIRSHRLHWSVDQNAADIAVLTENSTSLFDLILASDCLFFREFHDDLIQTIDKLLSVDGEVLLLQPKRDGTMDQFLTKCAPYFEAEFDENYSEKVSVLRTEYLQRVEETGYNEDIHFPILVTLRRRK